VIRIGGRPAYLIHHLFYRGAGSLSRSTVVAFADVAASFGDVFIFDCPFPQREVAGSSTLRAIGVSGMFSSTTIRTGVGHVMIEAPVEGGDTAIPRFLFRADVVRGVAVSRQVSRPVTIGTGTTVGSGFDGTAGASN
jgi:hypothetical protein